MRMSCMNRRRFLVSLPLMTLAGCTQKTSVDYGHVNATSLEFGYGAPLPQPYNCSNGGESPPLTIKNQYPTGKEKTWAVTAQSVPASSRGNDSGTTHPKPVTHWLIWNIPYGHDLPPNVPHGKTVSSLNNAKQGKNDFGDYGYTLGCPLTEKRFISFNVFTLTSTITTDLNIAEQDLVDKIYNSGKLQEVGGTGAVVGGK